MDLNNLFLTDALDRLDSKKNGFLLRSLSGGQKVKVVLGASMWSAAFRNSVFPKFFLAPT